MENEYGITVANKYALFLNEDEDPLEILKLQSVKKNDKTKKSATKEKEAKPSTNKQNGSSAVGQDKKTEKVDQFSSPTVNSEPVIKAAGVAVQGTGPAVTSESHFESGKVNRPLRDRAKPRSNVNRDTKDQTGEEVKTSEQFHDNRPPRIRARADRGSGGYPRQERRGFGENRQFRSENLGAVNEIAEKPNSTGNFERRERRPPRNGFSDQSAQPEGDRFNVESSEQSGGRGDRADRDGYGGRGYSRRGSYAYRGRIRPDRNQFSERGDQERVAAGFEDNQGRHEDRHTREGFNDNDGGNFMERSDREGFFPRRDSRGRRGGYGRGRGGYDRPPRRDYQRFNDRRQRSQEAEGETPSNDNKLASADEPKQQQQHDKLLEGGGSSWAEQIDAADQEAKKDNSNLDEEAGDAVNEAGGEPDVMTLDEWKAREDNKRVRAEFNIRKPGEGYNTDPQWKKMYVLSKKERAEEHDEEDEQEEEHHIKTRNVIPIEIHFADDSARGRGVGRRGGMGGPRGRGGRGGPGAGRWESDEYKGDSSRGQTRGGRGSYNDSRTYVRSRGGAGSGRRERTPNFADESDFPSLGSNVQP